MNPIGVMPTLHAYIALFQLFWVQYLDTPGALGIVPFKGYIDLFYVPGLGKFNADWKIILNFSV